MASYKRERDMAVAILRRAAKSYHFCHGCVAEEFSKCIYPDGPGEDVRCSTCGGCVCSSCHQQSNWTWKGEPAPDMAAVVRCRDCELDGSINCIIPLRSYEATGRLDRPEPNSLDNLLPACRSCNHYKSTMSVETFRSMLEREPEILARDSVAYRNAVRFGLVIPKPGPVIFYFERVGERDEQD